MGEAKRVPCDCGEHEFHVEEVNTALVVSAAKIEAAFRGTYFGGSEKTDVGRRGLMSECVLKRAAGYHDGFTIVAICKELLLLNKDATPSSNGIRWAFDQLYKSSSLTILERLQSGEADRTAATRKDSGS